MFKRLLNLRHSLVSKLIILVGIVLIISMAAWAYFNINYQKKRLMAHIIGGAEQLTNTIRFGTRYAMMLNSRCDIDNIISNIGKLKEIKNIRIYNKAGLITYANNPTEINSKIDIKADVCIICHRTDTPLVDVELSERTRIINAGEEGRLLGIITPIRNEPACATGDMGKNWNKQVIAEHGNNFFKIGETHRFETEEDFTGIILKPVFIKSMIWDFNWGDDFRIQI